MNKVLSVSRRSLTALRLSQLLSEYAERHAERLRNERKSVQNAAALITTSRQKRLLSSVEAFARTLAVHRRSIEKQEKAESGIWRRASERSSGAPARPGA